MKDGRGHKDLIVPENVGGKTWRDPAVFLKKAAARGKTKIGSRK